MKKFFTLGLAIILGIVVPRIVFSQESELKSLRGDHPIDEISEITKWKKVPSYWRDILSREELNNSIFAYRKLPLIRHSIEGYKIDEKFVKCLSCHKDRLCQTDMDDKENSNHFKKNSDCGSLTNVLDNMNNQHLFCTQCHVPQVDAEPLVDNTFKSQ